jgi:hypothetical protein
MGCRMSLEVEVRRNRGPRLGRRKNESIEFQNLEPEENDQLSVPFFWCFSSLLFSILHYFIGTRPATIGVGTGFTSFGVGQVELEFPRTPDPMTGHAKRY